MTPTKKPDGGAAKRCEKCGDGLSAHGTCHRCGDPTKPGEKVLSAEWVDEACDIGSLRGVRLASLCNSHEQLRVRVEELEHRLAGFTPSDEAEAFAGDLAAILKAEIDRQAAQLDQAREALTAMRDQRCDEYSHENCCTWDRELAASTLEALGATKP